MFQRARNMETAFQHIRTFSVVFLVACTILTVFIAYKSYQIANRSQQRIYVLANGKAIEAYAADRKGNIPVEAREHVKMFHQHFFTLDPDDKVINDHIGKALYLADGSAKKQYYNLKESGYYANLVAGNISQQVKMDSIFIETKLYPFYFRYAGRQRIIRPSTIVTRLLITEGYLRNVSRSDNNPHGFLIERWRILENMDLKTENR